MNTFLRYKIRITSPLGKLFAQLSDMLYRQMRQCWMGDVSQSPQDYGTLVGVTCATVGVHLIT